MDSIKDKSVLITGATGLIGSNLVDRLMQSDIAKLIVTGRSKKKLESTFPEYVEDERFVVVEHDASTPYPEDIKDIDFIFHAAGPMERNIVMNYPVNVIMPNVLGTINTLEFLRNQEKETGRKGRAIIFSSVTVYNNPTKEDYVAVEEETSYAQSIDAATACYSESKRMSEVIAKAYVKQYGVDAVIARFSTVYGPTRNVPDTAFYEFIKKSIAGEDITVNSNAAPRRDNIYVDDAIEGLITITLKGKTGESYNISSNGEKGNYAAVDEIAECIVREASDCIQSLPIKVNYRELLEQRAPGMKLANNRIMKMEWCVKFSQNEGIRRTIISLSNSDNDSKR